MLFSISNQHLYAQLFSDTGDSVWLKDVRCDGNELHILRCGYSVVSDKGNNDCTTKLLVKCGKETSQNIVA